MEPLHSEPSPERESLVEQISLFMLRKRQFPDQVHEALVVGKYYLLDKIDEGAMGIVCTALERNLGTVALKFPKPLCSPQVRDRIVHEGQLLAKVHHTNVLRVYEVGQCEGTLFIATEYVEGETLRRWQSVPGRRWRDIVGAYLQAGRGLAAIHARQIVHQDIKPDNIRVDRSGTVRILDFGLAHLESRVHDLESALAPVGDGGGPRPTFYRGGTPGYMAPEQFQREARIDARSDQFSFCAALWEALHGVLPYAVDVLASTSPDARRIRLGPPVGERARGVPRWLRAILLRGLSESPAARFPDMSALVTALERRLNARRWPSLVLGAVTGLAGAGLAALLSGPSLPMCAAPGDPFAGIWDDAREQELAQLVARARDPAAVPTWSAVRAALVAHRQRWSAVHMDLCDRAAKTGDPSIVLRRRACMLARRDDAALVVDGLNRFTRLHAYDPDAPWEQQRERWEQQLGAPEDCRVSQILDVSLASLAPRVDTALHDAREAMLAGELERARPLFERAIAAAGWLGDRRRRARARLELGRLALSTLEGTTAEEHLIRAVRDAEAVGDDLLAVDAASLLVLVTSDRPGAAVPWFELAMGRLERLGLATSVRALELEIRGGRLTDPEAGLTRAAALREAVGPHPHQHARELQARAAFAAQRGDLTMAVAHEREAVDLLVGRYGADAPEITGALRGLGRFHAEAGELADAEAAWLRALAIAEHRYGPANIIAATLHIHLAGLYYDGLDRPERARFHATRGGELFDRIGMSSDPPWRIEASLIRGQIELQFLRRFDRAAAHFSRGIALAAAANASYVDAYNLAVLHLGLAQAELQAGRPRGAQMALRPLLGKIDSDAELAPLRPHALQLVAELAIRADRRPLAVQHAREALACLAEEDREGSPLAIELRWTLAQALGPGHPEGREEALRLLNTLRRQAVPPSNSLQPQTIESWLRNHGAERRVLRRERTNYETDHSLHDHRKINYPADR